MHDIYIIKNNINQKIYVGQSKSIVKRWSDHRRAVKNNRPTQIVHHAMVKHGLDNFVFEVIAGCKTQDDANWAEEYFIQHYDSTNPEKGYNLTNGGSVAPKTEEWKQKVSQTLMGHEVSEETRQKLSVSGTGKIRSEEFKKNVGDFWRGKERTEEHRQNLSASLQDNQNCLGKQNALGYKHTEEAKRRIGDASRGKTTDKKGKTWKLVDGKRVWMDK